MSVEQEEDFLASVLADMKDVPTIPAIKKSRKRKSSPDYIDAGPSYSPPTRYTSYRTAKSASSDYEGASSDGMIDDAGPSMPDSDDMHFSPKKKAKTGNYGITPAIDRMGRLGVDSGPEDCDVSFDNSFDGVDMDAFMDVDDEDLEDVKPKKEPKDFRAASAMKQSLKLINGASKKEESDNPSWLSVYDSLSVAKDDTLGPLGAGSSSVSSSNISALESDGSLRFFWLDYLENEGKLYFIGKLKDKTSGVWVSCCVTVENLQRNLYVLPREKRVEQDEDGTLYETDEVPSNADVFGDFDRVRKKAKIKTWKAKFVNRKYAFGEADVPKDASWMKVVYSYTGRCHSLLHRKEITNMVSGAEPALSSELSSPNFSRIFGTGSSAFELLVLKRKIMGPCWLQIKNPQIDNKGVCSFSCYAS